MATAQGMATPVADRRSVAAAVGAVAFAVVVARLAWISDDAAITARVIANALHGFGPNFNITEKAQTFTHPLWFLLNTAVAAVTRDILLTMLAISIVCAGLTAYLVLRGRHWLVVTAVTLTMTATYALTEFGASGLENPLAWVLLALMWRCARTRRPLLAAMAGGLLVLTRLDLALIVGPFLALWTLRTGHPWVLRAKMAGLVVVPPAAWGLFGWIYYGSPIPETAYSKLNTTIPKHEFLSQGLRYAVDLTINDPIATLVIAAAFALAVPYRLRLREGAALGRRLPRESRLLVLTATFLYGGYVLWIGGDFMAGRFWTVPLLAAVIALADALQGVADRPDQPQVQMATLGAVALVALVLPPMIATRVPLPAFRDPVHPQPRSNLDESAAGIIDEWTFYVPRGRGLVRWLVQDPVDNDFQRMRTALAEWDPTAEVASFGIACGGVGFEGIISGPGVHWVVPCALSDPFLARMVYVKRDRQWRIGHFDREIPQGYIQALADGSSAPLAPEHRELFEQVSLPRRIERWADDIVVPP